MLPSEGVQDFFLRFENIVNSRIICCVHAICLLFSVSDSICASAGPSGAKQAYTIELLNAS